MGDIAGIGSFVSWNGGCLLIGRDIRVVVPVHAHYALQVAFGREPGVAFRSSDREEWRRYRGAIIPSRQPHSMDATTVSANAVMFVEPETREGRVITERYLADGIAESPESASAAMAEVFVAWESGNHEALVHASIAVIRALTGNVEPLVASDERILRVIDYINANLSGRLTLEEVAAQAFLSPSRFRHLFVEQVGMGLRPYVLWRRFLRVWELAMTGESLSHAAHMAGFADAAHLTRTARRMFGIPPSALRFDKAASPGRS